MLEALTDLGLFAAKAMVLVIALGLITGIIVSARRSQSGQGKISLINLGKDLHDQQFALIDQLGDKQRLKELKKAAKKHKKKTAKKARPVTYVVDFHGDIGATQCGHLAHKITALLQLARPGTDEVVVRLESAGGLVHAYGLAAAQLARLREGQLELTVCVDKLAASGGYMMAAMASRIVAAPFALVGSIGVVAMLPNIHRLLQRMNVDIELHTAGKYKRTLTSIGHNTEQARKKFKQDIEHTHQLFQKLIKRHRPELNISKVATGEVWYGSEAIKHKLVDELATSDAWLLKRSGEERDVFRVDYKERKKLSQKISQGAAALLVSGLEDNLARWQQKDYEQRMINQR